MRYDTFIEKLLNTTMHVHDKWQASKYNPIAAITTMIAKKMATGFIVCFSLTDANSLQEAAKIMDQVEHKCLAQGINVLPMVLVGCKSDLHAELVVSSSDIAQVTSRHQVPYFATSIKNGTNVEECFDKIVQLSQEKKQPEVPIQITKSKQQCAAQ